MTNQELNIAIAEACGWTDIPIIGGMYGQTPIPDYCNDLNAMHEAEKTLTKDQQIDFSVQLGRLVTTHLPASRAAWMDYAIAHATARQRAEALARTLNVWKD